jgi:hypothetical protein
MPHRVPPNHLDVRRIIEERLRALDDHKGAPRESVTVEWRGAQVPVPVISMPVNLLYYNPDTHRIRAQKSIEPEKERELNADPYGASAQAYLHKLLAGDPSDPSKVDPSFVALKEDLEEHGQNEPGIITRAGVLINGNTRQAALKDLGQPNIRVAVLPSDASHDDVKAVELSLQLRKDHRRDYSFMNFLLAIDESVREGTPKEKILTQFRIREKNFERARWILQFVNEAIERSRIAPAHSLRLIDFERHQGKLEELYAKYTDLKEQAPDDAELLREQRLMAIVLDKSKTDLRLIDPGFMRSYMKGTMPEPDRAKDRQADVRLPGTSISVPGDSPEVKGLRDFVTRVLQFKAAIISPEHASASGVEEADRFLGKLNQELEDALGLAGKQVRVKKRQLAPAERISDACDDLELAAAAIADARATSNFDAAAIEDAIINLKAQLIRLAHNVTRGADNHADGVAWLRQIVSLDGGND